MDARLPAQQQAVSQAIELARGFIQRAECASDAEARLCIIIEELVANIVEHGNAPEGSEIGLRIDSLGGDIGVTLSDAGTPFDPREAAAPGPVPPERGGGAGIALVLAWAGHVDYVRVDGRNVLTLVIPSNG